VALYMKRPNTIILVVFDAQYSLIRTCLVEHFEETRKGLAGL
jgi:hypothetical protein